MANGANGANGTNGTNGANGARPGSQGLNGHAAGGNGHLGGPAVPPPPDSVRWGEETALSLHFFAIGEQRMPIELVRAIAHLKWAAAVVHEELGLLDRPVATAIALAAGRVAEGAYDHEFPLSVWQTGSGTHSHLNVNEVVARLANEWVQAKRPRAFVRAAPEIDAHDHVNRGQSSNDVVPSAMHIAAALQLKSRLLPALHHLRQALRAKAALHADVLKLGRTHLQDATPITLGQELGGYEAQLALCEASIRSAMPAVHALAIGGTAVGTGLNTHPSFGAMVARRLAQRLHLPLVQAPNLFAALAGHEALVALHGALRMLAVALTKIACDIRLMASGPRAGLGELRLPANEPGSSMMAGKVNPSQIEALTMVCAQVMGHDAAIGFAASQGQFEINAYRPLIALNLLDSLRLLADAMGSFTWHCIDGLEPDVPRLEGLMNRSLMLGTALAPHLGHALTTQVVQRAEADGSSLREAALAMQATTAAHFDLWVDPRRMAGIAPPPVQPAAHDGADDAAHGRLLPWRIPGPGRPPPG
jgi:fumarate hydratase, class II